MKTVNSVDWATLLDSNSSVARKICSWANENKTTREVSDELKGTGFGSAFRHLVRSNGTQYGRRLARKALKYRGVVSH